MITDIKTNKKLNSIIANLFLRGKKIQHFTCSFTTILFQRDQNYKTKRDTLFYHDAKQKRTSTNKIK